ALGTRVDQPHAHPVHVHVPYAASPPSLSSPHLQVHWALEWTDHAPILLCMCTYPPLLLMLPPSSLSSPRPHTHPPSGNAHTLLCFSCILPSPPSHLSSPHHQVHWALEWTDHTPIPRVGVHIPYSRPFREATNHTDNIPRDGVHLPYSLPTPHPQVHWALEWTNHVPIPRVGVHIPYSWPFREATNHTDNMPRVIKAYISVSGYFAHEAICHAFPPGELDGCDDVNYTPQQQIWQYALNWFDWPAIKNKWENGTYLYEVYQKEMHCLYWEGVTAAGESGEEGEGNRRDDLVRQMRDNHDTPFVVVATPNPQLSPPS
ncbi:unnamed protein product, partial [Closterium sp. Naga37s-1]